MSTEANYTFRLLDNNDWKNYSELKLQSLSSTPAFFMRKHESEVARDESSWKMELEQPGSAILGAFHLDELIGVSTILTYEKSPNIAVSTGSYVVDKHRQGGVFKQMSSNLIEWCASNNFDAIIGSHREGNIPMQKMMLMLDFVCTGQKMASWADGTQGNEVMYRKELKSSFGI